MYKGLKRRELPLDKSGRLGYSPVRGRRSSSRSLVPTESRNMRFLLSYNLVQLQQEMLQMPWQRNWYPSFVCQTANLVWLIGKQNLQWLDQNWQKYARYQTKSPSTHQHPSYKEVGRVSYSFRSHSQIATILITGNGILLRCRLDQFKEIAYGSNFIHSERFHGKVTANNENRKGMEIVREKTTRLISLD